jgi:hypothetical protein
MKTGENSEGVPAPFTTEYRLPTDNNLGYDADIYLGDGGVGA